MMFFSSCGSARKSWGEEGSQTRLALPYSFTFLLFSSFNYVYIYFSYNICLWVCTFLSICFILLYLCVCIFLLFLLTRVYSSACVPTSLFLKYFFPLSHYILGSIRLFSANLFIPLRNPGLFPLPKGLGDGVTSTGPKDAATSLI